MLEMLGHARSYRFPFLKPFWGKEEMDAIAHCVKGGKLVSGEDIGKFELEIGKRFGAKFVFGTNSGRSAIQLALSSITGDGRNEVLVPTFGCTGTIQPIIQAGLKPVFVDMGEDLNPNPASISENITNKTVAAIVPSLCGKPAKWEEISRITKEKGLFVIDDAAQAFGAMHAGRQLGTLGDAGIFSFTLGKILTATGGGCLITDSASVEESVKGSEIDAEKYGQVAMRLAEILMMGKYRRFGFPVVSARNAVRRLYQREKNFSYKVGRIANLDAALALAQMGKLDKIIELRRRNAKILDDELGGVGELELPEYTDGHIFSKYIVKFGEGGQKRPEKLLRFARFLAGKGIEIEWSYVPLHMRKPFEKYCRKQLPVSEGTWSRLVTLPVNPNLGEEDMKYISSKVKEYFSKEGA